MHQARAEGMAEDLAGKSLDGFRLEELVGFGKTALVMRAQRKDYPNDVAVKIFDPELVDKFGEAAREERIRRELTLRDQTHENLVDIYAGGKDGGLGLHYVVMEFIRWPSLERVYEDVPKSRVRGLVRQLASAAKHLEDNGLAHRDIKPSNVAISPDFRHLKLLDLGVVRPIGEADLTDEEMRRFIGTLRYASPEFLYRQEDDSLTGWRALTFYQIGGVLHDIITGKKLFDGYSAPYARLVDAVKYVNPDVASAEIETDLRILAECCLVKEPDLRLRLVSWEDFAGSTYDPEAVSSAKQRIARKAEARSGLSGNVESANTEENRREQVRLERLSAQVQEIIRNECIGSDVLPRFELREAKDRAPSRRYWRLRFEASAEFALEFPLTVWITIDMINDTDDIIEVRAIGGLETEIRACPPKEELQERLYQGPFDADGVRRSFRQYIYPVFDMAQDISLEVEADSSPRWIHTEGGVE